MGGTMTAEALPEASRSRRDDSTWPVPPEGGYTADDLFTLHGLPPHKYAGAGIPNFWLVEMAENDRPVVWTYQLDPVGKKYVSTGVHHDRLKVSVPYDIDIDLTAIDKL
ncbi:hypothetical protein AB0E67_23670 [Streptomyces sp. NPDC032161]|uniref:hypothetical protein n=1 Tax=unclassified Streptomyces TaxID=2593676 RepID=UPI0033E85876